MLQWCYDEVKYLLHVSSLLRIRSFHRFSFATHLPEHPFDQPEDEEVGAPRGMRNHHHYTDGRAQEYQKKTMV